MTLLKIYAMHRLSRFLAKSKVTKSKGNKTHITAYNWTKILYYVIKTVRMKPTKMKAV